jgi:DNA polymerase III alpha subunit
MSLKYTLRTLFLLLFLLSFFLQAHNALAGEKITVKEILSNPNKYDGQEVTIQGKATKIKPRTSKKGNDSTIFTLKDESGKGMNIYTRGHPLLAEGQKVTVTGIYQKVKMVGKHTFRNEVKAWNIIR